MNDEGIAVPVGIAMESRAQSSVKRRQEGKVVMSRGNVVGEVVTDNVLKLASATTCPHSTATPDGQCQCMSTFKKDVFDTIIGFSLLG